MIQTSRRPERMLTVNSRVISIFSGPLETLASVLREELGLTGTKISCNAGDCGACTVLVGGNPVMSCQVPIGQVRCEITTVEGLEGPAANALRAAFIDEGAFQCGYCTSGQLMACIGLVANASGLSDAELANALSGNLCRCTGYGGIVRAIRRASEMLGEPLATGRDEKLSVSNVK